MIVYVLPGTRYRYLFIKICFKDKSLYYFHKKIKNKKIKKHFWVGFFRWFFGGFFGWGFLLPTLDLAVAGATNDVQLAERVECRAFFQVEASAPPEGGHGVDAQPQDVLPDIKGRIVNHMQRGQGPDWSLLFRNFFLE
jgi:hypothetical protein